MSYENAPNIFDVQEDLSVIVGYLAEIEQSLSEQSGFPVKLQQHAVAWRALGTVNDLIEAEDERRRAWKHYYPDEVGQKFGATVTRFLEEHGLTPEQLSEHLKLPLRTVEHISQTEGLDV
jgi:hypothetical protein